MIWFGCELTENLRRYGFRHPPVALHAGVEMIAAVAGRVECAGILFIPDGALEIDDAVGQRLRADPFVDGDAHIVAGHIVGSPALNGQQRAEIGAKAVGFGAGGAVKMEPVAFLVIKDGTTRVLPVTMPAVGTMERIVEMVPDIMDRVEKYLDKKKEKEIY